MGTRLDIINAMLAVNGESPVFSADSNNPAAIQASNALNRINRRIQGIGWWYNSERMKLSPGALDGFVILPDNVLSVDPVDLKSPYVQRGKRLYDPVNNTYNIGKQVTVDIVTELEVDELPGLAFDFLEADAVVKFYIEDDGDEAKTRHLKEARDVAWAYLQRENLAKKDISILSSDMGIQLRAEVERSIHIDRSDHKFK